VRKRKREEKGGLQIGNVVADSTVFVIQANRKIAIKIHSCCVMLS
jgi:hypothetical protein